VAKSPSEEYPVEPTDARTRTMVIVGMCDFIVNMMNFFFQSYYIKLFCFTSYFFLYNSLHTLSFTIISIIQYIITHHHIFSSTPHPLFNMQSTNICGNIITRANAPEYLNCSRACFYSMTRCITSNKRLGLALDQTVWEVITSSQGPSPENEEKEVAQCAIAQRDTVRTEQWKDQYENSLVWPEHRRHSKCLWNRVPET
jgi:hypothetical protein